MAFQLFEIASSFPNFDGPNAFLPNSTGFRKVGKSLITVKDGWKYQMIFKIAWVKVQNFPNLEL